MAIKYRIMEKIYYKTLTTFIKKFHLRPKLVDCTLLGSEYGKKVIAPSLLRAKPTFISGGAGEDVSFEIEFLNNFKGRVILLDPTEKSIKHLKKIKSHFGDVKKVNYSETGTQPIESYNLKKINHKNLAFIPKALWKNSNGIELFPPLKPEYASFSNKNFYKNNNWQEKISVPTTTISQICKSYKIDYIDVLKLDIEGSEKAVLSEIFSNKIFPKQIIIEIDELYFPSVTNLGNSLMIISKLLLNGYKAVGITSGFDLLYVHTS